MEGLKESVVMFFFFTAELVVGRKNGLKHKEENGYAQNKLILLKLELQS